MTRTRRDYRIISADSHTVEPPDLWEKWLERKYLDTAPKLVDDGDGGHAWIYMGAKTPEPLGLVTCVGTHPEELKWTGARYGSTIHPSCYEGAARLEVMDVDGVDAEMLYPPQRAMLTFMKNQDRDAHLAGIRAYNRWLGESFCAPDPDRLIGIFQMPNVGIETAVAELERAKKEGFRGVALSAWPSGGDNLRPEDDPFWDAAAELDVPVSIHLLLAAQQQKMGASNKGSVAIGASAFMYTMPILVEMIFQGVFDRFPKLRLALVEVGVGWIPHFLEMVDDRYWRNRHWTKTNVKKVPSEYFHDHCLATFIVDRAGIAIRHLVGVENMAWSTDFPHHGNDWPYSRRTIDSLFADVPAEERRKIVCTNAARFWGLV
ncbi:MAG TPA: amidohydrolase family protein [Candidatus Binatia bacterium]|nr:amidohydrolase family protein [Candidatus Binatia bacterium]